MDLPLLDQSYYQANEIIYYQADKADEIYFQLNGLCAFVIPFDYNVAYIQIENGDQFGDLDLVASARESRVEQNEMLNLHAEHSINLVRFFTVQAVNDTLLMKMNLTSLHRMQK